MKHDETAVGEQPAPAQSLCQPVDFFPWDGNNTPPEASQETSLDTPLTPYVGKLPIPPTVRPDSAGHLKMRMVPALAQLHPELPATTRVWTYRTEQVSLSGPQVPVGPTIEVEQREPAFVEWKNSLFGADSQWAKHPVVAVHDLPAYVRLQSNGKVYAPENLLGFTLGEHDHTAAALPPWTVVHLHGGRSEANSDGWPENAIYPGDVQRDNYGNRQPGTLLWYHDHAMSFTRLNVYAGLAGFYLIRDPRERELGLPCGSHDYELLLLIQDRALTCEGDHEGISAGQLLHKTGTAGGDAVPADNPVVPQAPMEFFGPLTVVNGCIWPRHTVKAGVYRLRILNGCSARTYRLRFTDSDGVPVHVPMQMIGSDGGLLHQPFDLNDANRPAAGSITLAPAERIDVLVDFGALKHHARHVELRNFAAAPFGGTDAVDPLVEFLTYSQVMRFDIQGHSDKHHFLPANQELMASATPWNLAPVQAVAQVERLLALVEDDAGVLQLMECAALKDDAGNPRLWDGTSNLPVTQMALQQRGEDAARLYCLLPGMFSDPVRFLARDGDVEIWKIINLSEDTHPIHIHLIQFKLLARDAYSATVRVPDATDTAPAGGYETHFDDAADEIVLDGADRGWKDTIRVNPSELTTIAVPFRDYAPDDTAPDSGSAIGMTGRYVYHCHILEHEDHEMMRPYVVMPPAVVEHMQHKNMHMMHTGVTTTPDENAAPAVPSAGWYMEPNLCCCDSETPMAHG